MTEVVVVHHLHDLQHTVVGCHCHQPCGRCHDLMYMDIRRALALYHYLGQVVCTQQGCSDNGKAGNSKVLMLRQHTHATGLLCD